METQGQHNSRGRYTVLDLGKVPTHYHHSFRKTNTTRTQRKTGVVAYLGGVHTLRVDTAIILLYVTNIISNIHVNNETYTV